jgi:hypothetical protein
MRPQTGQFTFGWQAHAQLLIKRYGQTLDQDFSVTIFGDCGVVRLMLGSNQPQDMTILLKPLDNFGERMGDTVDIRGIGFRHHRNVQVRSIRANPLYLYVRISIHASTMNRNCNSLMTTAVS